MVADSRGRRDVREGPVAPVAIEAMTRTGRHRRRRQRATVDQQEVDPAVIVEINERGPGPHRLDEILVRAGAVGMGGLEAGRCG
jgi:hypothetical protein